MLNNKNKLLKIKKLRNEKSSVIADKILMCLTFLFFFILCIYLVKNLPIKDIFNWKVRYGEREPTASEAADLLRTFIPVYIFIFSTSVTIIINFFLLLLNICPKFLLMNETSEAVNLLLKNIPTVKIVGEISHTVEVKIESGKMFRVLSVCNDSSLVDYGIKYDSATINIMFENFLRTNNKAKIKIIICENNYFKSVIDISFEYENQIIKENSLKINYYYVAERELKRWCKVNQIAFPLTD